MSETSYSAQIEEGLAAEEEYLDSMFRRRKEVPLFDPNDFIDVNKIDFLKHQEKEDGHGRP